MTRLDRSQNEFIAEAAELVEQLQGGLSRIDDDRRGGSPGPARLNEVFRVAHSLKGLAGMFGIDAMGRLAHQMETLLDALRLGKLPIDDDLMNLLYVCADTFARLLGDVKGGRSPGLEQVEPLVHRMADRLAGRASPPPQAVAVAEPSAENLAQRVNLPESVLSALTEYEEHRLLENMKAGKPMWRVHAPLPLSSFETKLTALTKVLGEIGEIVTTLPSTDDTGENLVFDLVVASPIDHDALLAQASLHGATLVERLDRAAPAPSAQHVAPAAPPVEHAGDDDAAIGTSMRQLAETVRVDIKKLDELMGIVGELVLARSGLSRVTNELKAQTGYRGLAVDLHHLVRTVERRIMDLQLAIMQVRMVPLGQVFERLARIVRRTASSLGKEVELVVSGEETELDKLIVEDIVDPLMHLVRNAIDHGLETTEQRIAAGKRARGTLELRAFPRGNHVVVEVVDDGRGIDEVQVKRTALERRLVDEERVGQLTRREVWNLIFQPGFSTRKEVTDLSGRGFGLDIVRTNIARLSGLIEVDSTPGRGSRFSITLPMTLAIIQAVIVRSRGSVYALPLASVLEIVAVEHRDLSTVEGREMIQLRGQTLPLLRLDRVFHPDEPTPRPDPSLPLGFAAVVGLAQHRVALLLDDVLGQQDIVIKSLGAYLASVRGIAGATHLGDHETILVLDVSALIQELIEGEGALSRVRDVRAQAEG